MSAAASAGLRPDTSGDAAAEYSSVPREAGFIGGVSGLLWASGPDAVSYLQGVLSQDVEGMAPGEAARSFLLAPRGKLEALLWVLRAEDADNRVGIAAEASQLEQVRISLERWRLRVEVELAPDPREVFDVWGPAGLDTADGWRDENGVLTAELRSAPVRRCLTAGLDRADLEERGLQPLGRQAAEAVRIEAGEPRMGVDVDSRTIPQETGLVPEAVSFTKGCFLGQELVARIDSRGRVNRNLRGVRTLDGAAPPAGAQVVHDGKTVGTLTSTAGSLALALIRREAPPGSRVAVSWDSGEARAVIEQLPMTGSSVPDVTDAPL